MISPGPRSTWAGTALAWSGKHAGSAGASRSGKTLWSASMCLRCAGWKSVNVLCPSSMPSQASVSHTSTCTFDSVPAGPKKSQRKGGWRSSGRRMKASVVWKCLGGSKSSTNSGMSSEKYHVRRYGTCFLARAASPYPSSFAIYSPSVVSSLVPYVSTVHGSSPYCFVKKSNVHLRDDPCMYAGHASMAPVRTTGIPRLM
mmetsp:Transcript_793/g.2001  ORF Transcript_793/g.2001 Transcript_793/m.2001 type:complete len:200 (-) Transcript_793:19-618(-)